MTEEPLLLETIRLIDGELPYLRYHQERLDESLAFHFGEAARVDLAAACKIPVPYRKGLYKLRVIYGKKLEKIEIQPYAVRPVESLQIVHIRELDYAHKYADRQALQTLFRERSWGDDVLLLRDGLLTDTSYANVALFDGKQWFTPARPLLRGTARARYLEEGILQEAEIRLEELRHFQKLKLINAMMNWEEGPVIDTEKIMTI